jgi:FAD:protein FMN transferase
VVALAAGSQTAAEACVVTEQEIALDCFGTTVRLRAAHADPGVARDLLERGRATAQEVHETLTRFAPDSELSRLNADARSVVPASPLLRRFAAAVAWAGRHSAGLVDATILDAVIAAGYDRHWVVGAAMAPARAVQPSGGAWASVRVDGDAVIRPPGVRLDSGGLGKGLAADLIAEVLAPCRSWVADCGGDLRLGGTARLLRAVEVRDPHEPERIVARLKLRSGGVATSGTTRRRWDGGHHLIDPRTGRPAESNLDQVTALAPTALMAEVRAKAALLTGEPAARAHLPDGGHRVPGPAVLHHLAFDWSGG